ncbi:hypothetical protein D3C80_834450 [compost metagenome]
MIETTAEFRIRAAQGIFGIGLDVAADIDEGEDEVAEFVRNLFGFSLRKCLTQFRDFFLDLVEDRSRVRPVETDAGGLFL